MSGSCSPIHDHVAGLGPPARSLADGDIGDTPAVDIGAGSDDALSGHRFGGGGGQRRDVHGFNPGQDRQAKCRGYGLCTRPPGEASTGKIPVKWLCLLTNWPFGQPDSNHRRNPDMKSAILVFPGINRERDMARALRLISGSEPAMVWHAETALPDGHRPRGGARRLLLRRLSALRRDRGAVAGDGRGARLCGQGRSGARRLQRLSDPLRSPACCPAS